MAETKAWREHVDELGQQRFRLEVITSLWDADDRLDTSNYFGEFKTLDAATRTLRAFKPEPTPELDIGHYAYVYPGAWREDRFDGVLDAIWEEEDDWHTWAWADGKWQ